MSQDMLQSPREHLHAVINAERLKLETKVKAQREHYQTVKYRKLAIFPKTCMAICQLIYRATLPPR